MSGSGRLAAAADERDLHTERRLIVLLDAIAGHYIEWIQDELRDLTAELQIIEASTNGLIKEKVQEQLARLDDINRRRLEDCKRIMRERVDELEEGDFRGVLEDQRYLDERLQMFQALISELLSVRAFALTF